MKTGRAVTSLAILAGGIGVPSPAEHLRDLAAECRVAADTVHDEAVRLELLSVAQRFERLARVREQQLEKNGPGSLQ